MITLGRGLGKKQREGKKLKQKGRAEFHKIKIFVPCTALPESGTGGHALASGRLTGQAK